MWHILPHRYLSWLAHFCEMQLFLMCISLPLLIAWGLPLSLGSLLGNLIFAPFLTIFLLVSSLLFFTEMLGIHNTLCAYALEKLCSVWFWMLNCAHDSWLIAYPKPPIIVLIAMPVLAGMIIALKLKISQLMRIGLLMGVLACSYGACHFIFACQEKFFYIECAREQLPALRIHKKTILVATPALSRLKSSDNWIDYHLMPELIKQCGTAHIDTLIVAGASGNLLRAVCTLLEKTTIDHIYLINWQGTAPFLHEYFRCRQAAREKNCILTRIGSGEQKIMLTRESYLSIKPAGHIKKGDLQLPLLTIVATIDNTVTTFYDANK